MSNTRQNLYSEGDYTGILKAMGERKHNLIYESVKNWSCKHFRPINQCIKTYLKIYKVPFELSSALQHFKYYIQRPDFHPQSLKQLALFATLPFAIADTEWNALAPSRSVTRRIASKGVANTAPATAAPIALRNGWGPDLLRVPSRQQELPLV